MDIPEICEESRMSSFSDRIKQFTQRVKFVKGEDIIALFPMTVGFIVAQPTKLFHKNLWLVCERKGEARDNGYWFFRYMCENHPEIETVYAIDKTAIDYSKVAKLGKVIQFGSLKHWIFYFAAKRNISSQKEGKPNAALCFLLEVYLGARKNRAYIRHGICKDDQRWVYYDVTKMNLFACSAKREFEFVKRRFGYPEGAVQLLGLCRFDNLLTPHEVKRQIIVMPTMREWLRNVSTDTEKYEGHLNIAESEYFRTWNSFLNNKELGQLLRCHKIKLLFFPHASLQKYVDLFHSESENITIANSNDYDVQTLLMESAMLITDYSSIYFDFAYMKKPLLYYQFDYLKYREGQYQEGYFSYVEDGFGAVVDDEDKLITEMGKIIVRQFALDEMYRKRSDDFFAFYDAKNCERTYEAIKEMMN